MTTDLRNSPTYIWPNEPVSFLSLLSAALVIQRQLHPQKNPPQHGQQLIKDAPLELLIHLELLHLHNFEKGPVNLGKFQEFYKTYVFHSLPEL